MANPGIGKDMKIRESGMPDEQTWSNLFDTELILTEMQIISEINRLVEFGCGYGTFTIPAARRINGNLYAFDIDKNMVDAVHSKIEASGIENIILQQRDILKEGTGLQNNTIDYVMLFNILHHNHPQELLTETHRILTPGGKAGIIHWRSDIPTPRGPDLSIRPIPEEIIKWVDKKMFDLHMPPTILEPYHFGLIISKN